MDNCYDSTSCRSQNFEKHNEQSQPRMSLKSSPVERMIVFGEINEEQLVCAHNGEPIVTAATITNDIVSPSSLDESRTSSGRYSHAASTTIQPVSGLIYFMNYTVYSLFICYLLLFTLIRQNTTSQHLHAPPSNVRDVNNVLFLAARY